ncbi:MAG: hypothetical protein ACRDPP_00085 [Gaiellaceae bacterium]
MSATTQVHLEAAAALGAGYRNERLRGDYISRTLARRRERERARAAARDERKRRWKELR